MKKKKHSKTFPSKLVNQVKSEKVLDKVENDSDNKLLPEIHENSDNFINIENVYDEKLDTLEKPNYILESLVEHQSLQQTNLEFIQDRALENDKYKNKDAVAELKNSFNVEVKTPSSMIDISESIAKTFIDNFTMLYNSRLEFIKNAFKI